MCKINSWRRRQKFKYTRMKQSNCLLGQYKRLKWLNGNRWMGWWYPHKTSVTRNVCSLTSMAHELHCHLHHIQYVMSEVPASRTVQHHIESTKVTRSMQESAKCNCKKPVMIPCLIRPSQWNCNLSAFIIFLHQWKNHWSIPRELNKTHLSLGYLRQNVCGCAIGHSSILYHFSSRRTPSKLRGWFI